MFDRFTDASKKSFNLARQEAQERRHDYLGPEHVLIGVLALEASVARRTLEALGADAGGLRARVHERFPAGSDEPTRGQLPFTSAAKCVLEKTMQHAQGLGHGSIGTGHLLLALLDEPSLGDVLGGLDRDAARAFVVALHSDLQGDRPPRLSEGTSVAPSPDGLRVLRATLAEAEQLGERSFSPVHLLLALVADESEVGEQLRAAGFDVDELRGRYRPDSSE